MNSSGPLRVPGADTGWKSGLVVMAAALPVCVMTAWVISSFADRGTPLWALWRPLALTIAFTMVVEMVAIVLLRDLPRAALLTLTVLLFLVGLWPLALGALILPAWIFGVNWLRSRRGERRLPSRVFGNAVANAGLFSIILVVVVVLRAAVGGAFWNPGQDVAHGPTAEARQNVYVLMCTS
jgi:hypothetical protein